MKVSVAVRALLVARLCFCVTAFTTTTTTPKTLPARAARSPAARRRHAPQPRPRHAHQRSGALVVAQAADVMFADGGLFPTTTFLTALGSNADVATLFSLATFGPQPLWLLMIAAPNKMVTKAVMGSWLPLVGFSLIHLAIVIISATQTDGTAPIKEFADVFDATGFPFSDGPQRAMLGMMSYVNFVSEEWPHVLTWDLLVGRLIWLDGLERGVFTPHSVLLTNLIGPPGLLLHFVTCLVTGKGLPPSPFVTEDDA